MKTTWYRKIIEIIKTAFVLRRVSGSLPDHYAGDLNKQRIKNISGWPKDMALRKVFLCTYFARERIGTSNKSMAMFANYSSVNEER